LAELDFAAWRSKRDSVTYRLPTEEEREYAARNGERADLYPWGPDWKDGVAVLKDATPSPVGSRADGKNRWGVYDLIGNVWEWTNDAYDAERKVIRGGSWRFNADSARCALRYHHRPQDRGDSLGLRIVRDLTADERQR